MAAAAGADPNALVRQGMNRFRDDDVEGSIEAFDAALAARPAIRPYLWQRGLSLYYVKQYQEGAQQVGARMGLGGVCRCANRQPTAGCAAWLHEVHAAIRPHASRLSSPPLLSSETMWQ